MNARSSSTVLFLLPTSPISPPTETSTPLGWTWRMKAVISAAMVKLFRCCSSSVGLLRSTRVEESMSML